MITQLQHENQNGELILNRAHAKQFFTADKDILTLEVDEKYTPIQIDGFTEWNHAVSISGTARWFCESV
jgi:hypothetical protein